MSGSEENILARVGGKHIAAALKALLDCQTAKEDSLESIIEVRASAKSVLSVSAK
jgi:hypothetical protein